MRFLPRTPFPAILLILATSWTAAGQTSSSAPAGELPELIRRLGDESYVEREAATRRMIALGPAHRAALQAALSETSDPETRWRLTYILDNLSPPQQAVLIVRATEGSELRSGDLVTHVNGRRVRTVSELRQRASGALGARARVLRDDGPHELGPITAAQIDEAVDYLTPHGPVLADALRLYAEGYAEQAQAALDSIEGHISEQEFPTRLRARIAYTAGDAAAALELLSNDEDSVRPATPRGEWESPSFLDMAGPGPAPLHIAWEFLQPESQLDFDLRVQRVLVPAHRYADAFLRSAELWWVYRNELGVDEDSTRKCGNQLAVVAWMLYEMGLRSECCRLIEPRSVILRNSANGVRKWVRVETDAWLAYFRGEEAAALDDFYEHASDILQRPPRELFELIRNPLIAARVAFFLYQFPEDKRVEETLSAVSFHTHPLLYEYVDWMLMALQESNQATIRRHLQQILPNLPAGAALRGAKAVALLEYIQEKPDIEVLQAARQRIADSAEGPERARWLPLADALLALAQERPAEAETALRPLRNDPQAAPLLYTLDFLLKPPPGVREQPALRTARLAIPLGESRLAWLILGADRRLLRFDVASGRLDGLRPPSDSWFPNPLTWPWFGRQETTGRVWAYDRRRVIELNEQGAAEPVLNIQPQQIADFAELVGPVFGQLIDARQVNPISNAEDGEFLRAEVLRHAEMTTDPDLPEIGVLEVCPQDARVGHVGLRGGPHFIVDRRTGQSWDNTWLMGRAGLPKAPDFFVHAQWPATEQAAPLVWLMSDQGLLRFDMGDESVARVALPGPDPFPAVIPESMPYLRRDPRFVYCARPPADGGGVFRVTTATNAAEALEVVNEVLPESYYATLLRSALRSSLSTSLVDRGAVGLEAFIADSTGRIERWSRTAWSAK